MTDPRVEAVERFLCREYNLTYATADAVNLLAAADAAAETAGWRMMPEVATSEMKRAIFRNIDRQPTRKTWAAIYAAAPKIGGDDG